MNGMKTQTNKNIRSSTDNDLIADFIGDERQKFDWNYLYDTSWDWIMPVVEKIRTGRYGKEAFGSVLVFMDGGGYHGKWNCSILGWLTYQKTTYDGKGNYDSYEKIETPHISIYNDTHQEPLIICTYKAVVEFIKWYNKQIKE